MSIRSCLTFSPDVWVGSWLFLTQHCEQSRRGRSAAQGPFLEISGFLTFSDRNNIWLWTAAEPMHQYEVTGVNCPFRCFSLSVHCINTHEITLYGCYYVSQSMQSPSYVSSLYYSGPFDCCSTLGNIHNTTVCETVCLLHLYDFREQIRWCLHVLSG